MKREEAIQMLKAYRDALYFTEILEALDMAIEALKREDTMLKEIEHAILYGERKDK